MLKSQNIIRKSLEECGRVKILLERVSKSVKESKDCWKESRRVRKSENIVGKSLEE